jgi:hypothetical protein
VIGRGTGRGGQGRIVPLDWLHLAATPTFALMAGATALHGGPADILCAAAHGPLPLDGMTTMYALMSAFHSGPWFRLATGGATASTLSSTRL